MIPRECKRLAEVDFPIAVVSKHAVRDNSARQGHPRTLHLWWARRPLASCRAMLLALLLPDPCDERCPPEFKEQARETLGQLQRVGPSDEDLRRGLLRFIGDFANWDHAAHPRFLEVGRGLVRAAHPDERPLVVDPFAGGGSIPLEGLRLGCEAFASDLNPVACLILKVMLEDIPRSEVDIAHELRRIRADIKGAAESELAELYPVDPNGARPVAYLWARTVRCESPDCGAEIPLIRSMWLSEKASRRRALAITNRGAKGALPEFEIFEPRSEAEVDRGTVSRAKATCPGCNIVLSPERVRAQLRQEKGGSDVVFDAQGRRAGGARLVAVVTQRQSEFERNYRLPDARDYQLILDSHVQLAALLAQGRSTNGIGPVPDEPLSRVPVSFGVINVWVYGMSSWGDLFTKRQKLALARLADILVRLAPSRPASDVLALSFGKVLRHCNVVSKWHRGSETVAGAFGMQAIPMSWDFPEMPPLAAFAGGLSDALDKTIESLSSIKAAVQGAGQAEAADAARHPLPDMAASVWFTDPPYYDAVPYSYLSDFFYVWLRRALKSPYPALFSADLTPKDDEIVAYTTPGNTARTAYDKYEERMAQAFAEGRRVLRENGIGSVVFAHKTTEGWEALLSGIFRAGWTITASWPIATERGARLRARDSAVLATSVHLVCRPRPDGAGIGDWGDVLRELPQRVGQWMERLQAEGVRGADLVFACIGPALEIFSRHSKVETAEGREVELAEYLEKVWEVVGRAALRQVLGQEDGAGALEEDARLAALFLWTLQSTAGVNDTGSAKDDAEAEEEEPAEAAEEDDEGGSRGRKAKGYTLVYDVVRRFAQPLGIHLEDWERRIIETKKGTVRLLPIQERATQLFGEDGAHAAADQLEAPAPSPQLSLFPEMQAEPRPRRGRRRVVVTAGDDAVTERRGATTLDRVHAAMLLQASGRANALRALLAAEVERGPEFLRLANALSALYPRGSEEKRLLDAMLLAVPR